MALERLAEFAPEQARALGLMIFGGLTGEEAAQALGVSASTIDRRIRLAKAWLRRELTDDEAGSDTKKSKSSRAVSPKRDSEL